MRKIVDSMNIKILENEKERMKIEFLDETETLTQILATNVWNEGGKAASVKEHPFLENAKLVISGKNPKRLLKKAATLLEADCDDFKEEFQRALQK